MQMISSHAVHRMICLQCFRDIGGDPPEISRTKSWKMPSKEEFLSSKLSQKKTMSSISPSSMTQTQHLWSYPKIEKKTPSGWSLSDVCPLVIWHSHSYWKRLFIVDLFQQKLWLSIVMFVYQRVPIAGWFHVEFQPKKKEVECCHVHLPTSGWRLYG